MTAVVLSLALVLTPAPVTARQETPLWPKSSPSVLAVAYEQLTSSSLMEPWLFGDQLTQSSSVEIESAAPNESPPVAVPDIPPPAPTLSPIEQGLNRLSELGANDWQLRTFGCIAWFESGNNPNAWNPYSRDAGLWQLNLRYHQWRWAGRDIFDPVVNAEIAWQVYSESGFRAWVVHSKCGV